VKATGTHRRFEQVLSKLGTVEKTERLIIIYFNKLNWFTEYLPTLSNTQRLGYWDIYHLCTLSLIQCIDMEDRLVKGRTNHRHSNSGPPFFLIWSLPRLWYGSLSGSISLNYLSIFYNISCDNSLVLLTFVSRSSCRITYIYIKVWNNRQNTKRESSLRLDILQ
jgi:hypothetical protein